MAGRSLLIVSKDPAAGVALADLLRREGFDVDLAASAASAMEQAEEKSYQVAILDEMVGTVRGPELYERIERAQGEIEGILCSEAPTLKTVQIALDFGMKRVVTKPVDAAEIISLLQEALQSRPPPTGRPRRPLP